jgi:hypothetical protein
VKTKCVFFAAGFLFAVSFAFGESYFTVGYEHGFLWERIEERGAELKTDASGSGVNAELMLLSDRNIGIFFHGRAMLPQKAKSTMSGGSGYNPDDYNTNIVNYVSWGIGFAFRVPLGERTGFRAGLGFNYAFFVENETKQTYSGGRFSYLEKAVTKHIGLAGSAGFDFRLFGGWFLHTGVSLVFDFSNSRYPSLFEPANSVEPYQQTYSLFIIAPCIGLGLRF